MSTKSTEDNYREQGYHFKSTVVDGVHYPVYKLVHGADGEATFPSTDNPIPVGMETDLMIISALGKLEKQLKI